MKALKKLTAKNRTAKTEAPTLPPKLGHVWAGQGGTFVGTVRGTGGAPDYHLIVGPEMEGEATFNDAVKWASKQKVDGHKDFDLPNRRELRFLFCNGEGLFKPEWYWSGEQHAVDSALAWSQAFGYGYQHWRSKGSKLRARAVRRLDI